MKCEYKIKKGKHYFLGPKLQLTDLQIAVFAIFLILGIFVNKWFLIGSLVSYIVFLFFIQKALSNMKYRVFFLNNCAYKLTENFDQINKLFGASGVYHHWSSARIGWRCIDYENIELFAYCYINGKRIYKKIATCKTDTDIICSIKSDKNQYVFNVTSGEKINETCSIPRPSFKISNIFMYKLYPYFGGQIPSPKFMKLYLEKI